MRFNTTLLICSLFFSFSFSSTIYAAPKRVIDKGMIDGQRMYLIACDDGSRMHFIKKFTAPKTSDTQSNSNPRNRANAAEAKPAEYIQSCLQTNDERGEFCQSDTEWSATQAAEEYCN